MSEIEDLAEALWDQLHSHDGTRKIGQLGSKVDAALKLQTALAETGMPVVSAKEMESLRTAQKTMLETVKPIIDDYWRDLHWWLIKYPSQGDLPPFAET